MTKKLLKNYRLSEETVDLLKQASVKTGASETAVVEFILKNGVVNILNTPDLQWGSGFYSTSSPSISFSNTSQANNFTLTNAEPSTQTILQRSVQVTNPTAAVPKRRK